MNNIKDAENRASVGAAILNSGRQKVEDSHSQRQNAEASHGQRSSHAKQIENRPRNTHPFVYGAK